jgi:NitT/TauT family transport system ATP-binding protein
MSAIISLRHISKTFQNGKVRQQAIDDISLDIQEGEFFLFVGPSGCGKSTLLRIMSGLEKDHSGKVTYGDGFFHRDISFVFQQFALLPWLTVFENVELALIARDIDPDERKKATMQELRHFGLAEFANVYPHELSGGMKQRVGIARALVTQPKILFMDEPFSELDSFTATSLRQDLLKIWEERNITVVMVSHIVPEAVELADRIAVLGAHPGHLVKIVENKLPRPRQKRSPEFFKIEDELYGLIKV